MLGKSIAFMATAWLIVGCGTQEREGGYVAVPSVGLYAHNVAQMRLSIGASAVLAHDQGSFEYRSATALYSGSYTLSEQQQSIEGAIRNVVTAIDYTAKDGYVFTADFSTLGSVLNVGDTVQISGDVPLGGVVGKIEIQRLD